MAGVNWMNVAGIAIPAVAAAVGLMVALALLGWALRLLIRPVIWAGRRVSIATGFGAAQFALAFLVAAVFEPAPFRWVLIGFVFLVSFLAYSLPLAVISLAGALPQACAGGSAQQCAGPILEAALGLWTGERPFLSAAARAGNPSAGPAADTVNDSARSVRDILRSINNLLPLEALQSLISALVIVGMVLFLLWLASGKTTYLRGVDWRGRYFVVLYKGAAMTASLLFALYLSIAAIVAIPVFKNDPTDKLREGQENIKDEVPKLRDVYLKSLKTYEVHLTDLPNLDELRTQATKLITARTGEQVATFASPAALQYWLDTRLGQLQAQIDDARASATRLNNEFATAQEEADRFGEQLQSFFLQQNTGHIGGYLTQQHARSLVGSDGAWLAEYRSRMVLCSIQLNRQKLAIQERSSGINQQLEFAVAFPNDPSALFRGSAPGSTAPACNELVPPYDDYLVRRQNAGESLLLFGRATRWLLWTESRDLALIVGLLGFGFFGALASSFIRRAQAPARSGRVESEGDTAEMTSSSGRGRESLANLDLIVPALIRGVAAAVLIFLAVAGGIAVFTRADPEPNPYAVFLACFIASVFSEDVWEWAHRRQTAQLGKDKEQEAKASADAGAASPPTSRSAGRPLMVESRSRTPLQNS